MSQSVSAPVFKDPAQLAAEIRRARPDGALVGLDGFMNSGKTRLAFELSDLLDGIRVGLDSYVDPGIEGTEYVKRLRLDYLAKDLRKLTTKFPFVLVEGICLARAMAAQPIPVSLSVYVKRVSRVGIWHDEHHLEHFESGEDSSAPYLRRSQLSYHAAMRPHEKANYVYERTET